jgi:hypothetical protein
MPARQHNMGDIAPTMVCGTCAPKSDASLIKRVILEILRGRICIAAGNDQSLLRP